MCKICIKVLLGMGAMILTFSGNSQTFKNVNIVIEQDSINELESHPFTNEDVHGDFVVNGQTFNDVELHYRGAFYLFTLIRQGSLRNWKVKFPKSNKFENRREWNFNYENFIRQNLAYHIFREAGIPVVSSENVILHVNGVRQGLYLKYEDPDNKDWLEDVFGDNDGDLYKAAFDSPNEVKFFADLTYLGPDNSDYFFHYRKQTNKKGVQELDYSTIRKFTELINNTPKEEFEKEILKRFDVASFIKYVAISNFISNWDSYPYRPKNFFLYDNPDDGKWHYIPWDVDGTFQEDGSRNPLGTTGSIFHYFDGVEPYNNTPTEPLERPLLWNIMEVDRFRDKYCYEYKKAIETFLDVDHLYELIDSIALGVANNTSGRELAYFNNDVLETKDFIAQRMQNVMTELDLCKVDVDPFLDLTPILSIPEDTWKSSNQLKIYPNPASSFVTLNFPESLKGKVQIKLFDLTGKTLKSIDIDSPLNGSFDLMINSIEQGQYLIVVNNDSELYTTKLEITN